MSRKTVTNVPVRIWASAMVAVAAGFLAGAYAFSVEDHSPHSGYTGEYDQNGPIMTVTHAGDDEAVTTTPPPVTTTTTVRTNPNDAVHSSTAPRLTTTTRPKTAAKLAETTGAPCTTCVRPGLDIPGEDGLVTPPPMVTASRPPATH